MAFLPLNTNPSVLSFCEKLVPKGTPQYLTIEKITGAEVNECVNIVGRQLIEKGGKMQYGWKIWEILPQLMLEAVFHAVWVDTSGNYHDFTPEQMGITKVMFLADPSLTYDGKQINSVREALVDDPIIHKFIESLNQMYEATNRGELAFYKGPIYETPELRKIKKDEEYYRDEIMKKYYPQYIR